MQIINEIKKITFKPSLMKANKMNPGKIKQLNESIGSEEMKELKRSAKLIWFRKGHSFDYFQDRETGEFWSANIFF